MPVKRVEKPLRDTSLDVRIPEGVFALVGNVIENGQRRFLIAERQNTTSEKSSRFLLMVSPKRSYVSSLWYVSDNVYEFEYLNIRYVMVFAYGSVKIFVKKKGEECEKC